MLGVIVDCFSCISSPISVISFFILVVRSLYVSDGDGTSDASLYPRVSESASMTFVIPEPVPISGTIDRVTFYANKTLYDERRAAGYAGKTWSLKIGGFVGQGSKNVMRFCTE